MIAASTGSDVSVEEAGRPYPLREDGPASDFNRDGFCPSCLGYAEHFAFCEHATWERRNLA